MTTLLTANEVHKYTMIDNSIAACSLSNIFQTEFSEFRTCLGIDFYNSLKGDLVQHNYTTYTIGTEYTQGQKVVYQGIIYECLSTTKQNPNYREAWKVVDKFNKKCFNDLWCNFLANYLSWRVLREHEPYLASQLHGKSLGEITQTEYNNLLVAVDNSSLKTLNNMKYWVQNNNTEGCFDNMKFIAKTCCKGCGCSKDSCSCDCSSKLTRLHQYSMA